MTIGIAFVVHQTLVPALVRWGAECGEINVLVVVVVVVVCCRILHGASTRLADWYFYKGLPVKSACCHLAVGDVKVSLSQFEELGFSELIQVEYDYVLPILTT